jgi:hypothetical protein
LDFEKRKIIDKLNKYIHISKSPISCSFGKEYPYNVFDIETLPAGMKQAAGPATA